MNMRRLVYVGLACVFGSSLLLGQTAAPANPGEPGMDLAGYWNNVFHQDAGLGTGGGGWWTTAVFQSMKRAVSMR